MGTVRTTLLTGFDDPRCSAGRWQQLLGRGDTDVVFLTWHWLHAWWQTLGKGELLLIAAEREGEIVALAPLHVVEGMVLFLGLGESDYLDFIGDISDPDVLTALLETARSRVPNLAAMRFHSVLDRSRTGQRLQTSAARLGFRFTSERWWPAVEVDLAGQREAVRGATQRSMRKREEAFCRRGRLEVRRFRDLEAIRPQLQEFYAQHIARWQAKDRPSPFADPGSREFLERFLQFSAPTGWIRFLRLDWDGRPLAFEFAWYYRGIHFSGPWCFALDQARYCPGHVLLRRSLRHAMEEDVRVYDLGVGTESYKFRLPAQVKNCCTWGLYPP